MEKLRDNEDVTQLSSFFLLRGERLTSRQDSALSRISCVLALALARLPYDLRLKLRSTAKSAETERKKG